MKQKYTSWLLAVIFSVGLIVSILLITQYHNRIDFFQQTIPSQQSLKNISVPALPEGYEWEAVDGENQELKYIKWIKDANLENESFGIIPLSGKEWVTYVQLNSPADLNNQTLYDSLTQDLTEENGWHETFSSIVSKHGGFTDVVINNHEIFGMPLSPTIGGSSFINYNDEKIIVINYVERSDDKNLIKNIGSVDYNFPHFREYRIFISDALPIEKILNNKIEQKIW